jgi:hypothetical protein
VARAGRTPRARGPPRVDPRALAELVEVEPFLLVAERARPLAPPLLGRARGKFLADHAEGQELVALQAQDRLEPLHVLLGKQPVAALRALRVQQPLVLEIADLRDRDVRELGLQPPADRADREEPFACRERLQPSAGQERQPVFADLDLVAVAELGRLDPRRFTNVRSGSPGPR